MTSDQEPFDSIIVPGMEHHPANQGMPLTERGGTVFILQQRDGQWWASWQQEVGFEDHTHPDKEAVLAWARSVPADRRLILDPELGDYVPLD